MDGATRYYVYGPDSGGVYFLDVTRDELTHGGSGENMPTLRDDEVHELVSTYLMRFGDRSPDFEPVARLRADLDGDYRLGVWRVRFRAGRALDARVTMGCPDTGRGGHSCGDACLGPLNVDEIRAAVSAMCGRRVEVAQSGWRDAPSSAYVAEGVVAFIDEAQRAAR